VLLLALQQEASSLIRADLRVVSARLLPPAAGRVVL